MKEATAFVLAIALAVFGRAVDMLDDCIPGQRLSFTVRQRKMYKGGNYLKIG